jgi:hypothetical protein
MKKGYIIIFFSLFFLSPIFGQKRFIFDEFFISGNKTDLSDNNTENRFGFGVCMYHIFKKEKLMNLVAGVEYNNVSQYKKKIHEGHFSHSKDLTYSIDFLSFPIGIRYNIGSKTKFFTEVGGFADLFLYANRKGTTYTYLPGENNIIDFKVFSIDEKVVLSSSFGIYLSFGAQIPISKYVMILKPEYKFGLNKLNSGMDSILNRYYRISFGLNL